MQDVHSWIQQWLPVYYDNGGYYALPLAGIVLVGLHHLLKREAVRRRAQAAWVRIARGASLAALIATAVVSVAVYNNFFNYHYGGYLNAYEFFHYYLGSKYADEIGYFGMYGTALAADVETGRIYWPNDGAITDLRTHRYVPVEQLLGDAPRYRALFSSERWREWVGDVFYFKKRMAAAAWNRILHDKGYNATPVWSAIVGGALSGRVSTHNERGMLGLALLDALLLAAATACVAWAFGTWPALLMVVLLASSYLMAHVHMKGAFLRTDFVVCLILAVCLLKRRWHALAGALVGYSVMSRLFPAVFLFGPAAKLLWGALPARARQLRFFSGFALSVALLFGVSVVHAGGFSRWTDFAAKIAVLRGDDHPWNVGLSVIVAEQPALIRSIQLAALVLCFFAVRGLEDHRALAFGFVPLFLLVAPTYYYYVVLLVPFLFLAEKMERAPAALGVAYMLFMGLAGHWLYQRFEQSLTTYYWSSVLALVLALYLLALAFCETGRRETQ